MQNKWLSAFLHPKPEVSKVDTNLRYTDILFGFVIRELFLRLQFLLNISWESRLHLFTGTVLVLGSWIGFRRSLNRSAYEVKFFNIPLIRFLLDQVMLICYFRIATLTSIDLKSNVLIAQDDLIQKTVALTVLVFVLYILWDALGIAMASAALPAENNTKIPRYPKPDDNIKEKGKDAGEINTTPMKKDIQGLVISVVATALLVVVWILYAIDRIHGRGVYLSIIVIVLLYRWAKDVRSTLKKQN